MGETKGSFLFNFFMKGNCLLRSPPIESFVVGSVVGGVGSGGG